MTSFDTTTTFFSGNSVYIEELYERFLQNPQSVDASWREYFATMGGAQTARNASWTQVASKVIGAVDVEAIKEAAAKDKGKKGGAGVSQAEIEKFAHDSIRAIMMVRAYRVRGHLLANLDPLDIENKDYHPELSIEHYGFTDADLDREIFLDGSLGIKKASLREIVAILRQTYCGNVGVEFMHIQDPDQKAWIQQRFE
ncbi:MAG: 2-oxoglutarate dehydrogenase E1 component, partial [Rickettsiales bacterium]|nr:2-oxoglutarate dehydrogenase E1 component [Rickettsiales bacterium]